MISVTSWSRMGWRCVFPPLASICHLGAEDYKDQGLGSKSWGSWRLLFTKRRKTVGLVRNTPQRDAISVRDRLLLGGIYLFQHLKSPQLFNPSILVFFSRQGTSKPLPDSKQRPEVVSEGEYRCWQAGRVRGGDDRKATVLRMGTAVDCSPGVANCRAAQRTIVPSPINNSA